ncbi:hypothetical protein [Ferrimicrobium sp.]|jgi:DNA-binding transcriptional regulator LsrR (DeoR family)|uniref:hypothetical protein n=1 Tax=Ferrimicrobium sp. TaxID=2926050 RepID=UPI00261F9153|nr:hypothetical protein [Ferrimicrobium sp.]
MERRKRGTWGTEMGYAMEVIRVHFVKESNRNEIAQSLGISRATVTRIPHAISFTLI